MISRKKITRELPVVEAVLAFHALTNISQEKTSAKGKFWIGLLYRRLAEIETPYREQEIEIIKKFGVLENGNYKPKETESGEEIPNSILLSSDGEKQLRELRAEKISLEFYPLSIDDFDGVECSIEHIARLENFILIEEEEEHE